MTEANSDAELVERAKGGEEEAFRQLVERHGAGLLGLCRSLVRNFADAEDAGQEAMFRAYLRLGGLRNGELFGPWLRRIAYRTCLDHLKRGQPRLFELDERVELAGNEEGPGEALEREELNEQVRGAVKRLPTRYRLPVMMRDLEGMTYQEVAGFLGVPVGTAKSHVFIGRKMLREDLKPLMEEEVFMPEQERMSERPLYPRFTDLARQAVGMAREEAAKRGSEVGVIDLAAGLVELSIRETATMSEQELAKIGESLPFRGGLGGMLMRRKGVTPEMLRAGRATDDGDGALAGVFRLAINGARELGQSYVGTEHLLLGIVAQEVGTKPLLEQGVTREFVRGEIKGWFKGNPPRGAGPRMTYRGEMAVRLAQEAGEKRGGQPGVVDLAAAIIELPEREGEMLRELGQEKLELGGNPGGLGAKLMREKGVTAERVRAQRPAGDGGKALMAVWNLAMKAATDMKHGYVSTEHLLLGIASQEVGSEVLHEHGLTAEFVRGEIERWWGGKGRGNL